MNGSDATPNTMRSSVIKIPKALRERDQWLALGLDKAPIDSTGKIVKWGNEKLLSFDTIYNQVYTLCIGSYLGFIIRDRIVDEKGRFLACADIDFKNPETQIDPEVPKIGTQELTDFISSCSTYAELSPSGKGYHIWFWVDLPVDTPAFKINVTDDYGVGISVHDHAISITGKILPGSRDEIGEIPLNVLAKILKWSKAKITKDNTIEKEKFQIPERVEVGQRNRFLTSYVGKFISQGMACDQVLTVIRALSEQYQFIELSEEDYAKTIPDIYNRLQSKQRIKTETIEKHAPKTDVSDYALIAQKVSYVVDHKDKQGNVTSTEIVFDRQKFVLHIIDKFSTISFGGVLWIYRDGIYRQDSNDIRNELTSVLRTLNMQSQTHHYNEIIGMLLGSNVYQDPPFNRAIGYIPVKNGVVKLNYESGKIESLLPHSPEYKFTFTLNVNYNYDAPTAPVTEIFSQWVDSEYLPILAEIPALGIVQAQRNAIFKRQYLCQGETNSGKSSYMTLLHRFFGDTTNTICSVSIQSITKNRFSASRLDNKLINLYDDLESTELENYGEFKKITGIICQDIEEKGKPIRPGRIYCNHLFTCNSPPKLPDAAMNDAAFFGRWEFIPFPNEFPIDPTWYDKTFTDEFMSGLLNLVLGKILTCYKTGTITKVTTADDVMSQWMLDTDPLFQFIDENTELDPKSRKEYIYGKNELMEQLRIWYSTNNIDKRKQIADVDNLTKKIMKYGFIPTQRRLSFEDKNQKKSYTCRIYITGRRWKGGLKEIEPQRPEGNIT